MKTTLLLFFLLSASALVNAQPANDACENPQQMIVLEEQLFQANTNITGVNVENEPGCDGTPNDNYVDVWYEFTMPITGNFTILPNIFYGYALYNSCGDSTLACVQSSRLTIALQQNETYLVRVFCLESNLNSQFISITYGAYEAPENDTCPEAITLTMGVQQTVDFNTSGAQVNNEQGCSGSTIEDYSDVWYDITLPVDANELFIESQSEFNQFALFDTCNGNELGCISESGSFAGLSGGQQLKLRVFRVGETSLYPSQTFVIYTSEIVTNDSCENAQVIIVDNTFRQYTTGMFGAEVNNEEGCAGDTPQNYADIWYEFTMPVDGTLYVFGNQDYNKFAIYEGCNGNQVACFEANKLVDNLVEGQTYKLRFYRTSQFQDINETPFTIRAFERAENDECSNAELLPALSGESTLTLFNMAGATVNNQDTCAGTSEDNIVDVWYEFTMPYEGNLFIDSQHGVAVYEACNGNQIFCNPLQYSVDAFKLISGLTAGENYLIRLFSPENWVFAYEFQSFSARVYPRAENDDCVDAEIIPEISTDAENPTYVDFYTFGSVITDEVGCEGDPSENHVDVWFEFTMPSNGTLNIESYQFNRFAIYDACNGNQFICFAGSYQVENLTANETYILRVFQKQTLEMFHPESNFDIWVSETLSIPSEDAFNTSLKLIGNNSLLIQNLHTSASLEIYNIMGQKLRSISLEPAESQSLELNNPTGIYFAKLTSKNDSNTTLKIVVKN